MKISFELLQEKDMPQSKAFLSENQNLAFVVKLDGGLMYGYSLTRMDKKGSDVFHLLRGHLPAISRPGHRKPLYAICP